MPLTYTIFKQMSGKTMPQSINRSPTTPPPGSAVDSNTEIQHLYTESIETILENMYCVINLVGWIGIPDSGQSNR